MPKRIPSKARLTEAQRDRLLNILREIKLLEQEVLDRSWPEAIRVRDATEELIAGLGLYSPPARSEDGEYL